MDNIEDWLFDYQRMCRLHTAQYRECDEWKERKETVYWRIQEKKIFQKEQS